MTTQRTQFRGKQNILEKTVWDQQVADNAGIQYHKLEKYPLAADGSIVATGHLNMGSFRIIGACDPVDDHDVATKYFVENLPARGHAPVDYIIHYIKDTAGAPHGTATENELCLNINDVSLYRYNGTSWDLVSDDLSVGQRYLFAISGTDTSGLSGIYHCTNLVYEIFPANHIHQSLAHNGVLAVCRFSSKDVEVNSGWVFDAYYNLWRCLAGSGGGGSNPSAILPGRGLSQEINTFNVNVDNYSVYINNNNEIIVSPDFIKNKVRNYLVAGEGIHLNQIDTPAPNSQLEIEIFEVDGGEWQGSSVQPFWVDAYDFNYFTNGGEPWMSQFDKVWDWWLCGDSSFNIEIFMDSTWRQNFRPTKMLLEFDPAWQSANPNMTADLLVRDTGNNPLTNIEGSNKNLSDIDGVEINLDFSNNLDFNRIYIYPNQSSWDDYVKLKRVTFYGVPNDPYLVAKVWGTNVVQINIPNLPSNTYVDTTYMNKYNEEGSFNSLYAGFVKFTFGKAVDINACSCIVGNMGFEVVQDMSTWTANNPSSGYNSSTGIFHLEPWDVVTTNQIADYQMRQIKFDYTVV